MAAIVHLEPKEFVEKLFETQTIMEAHPYVLNNGVAAMIYMFQGNDTNTYYLDRAFTSVPVDDVDPNSLHADMYRKVALDVYLRNRRV